MAELALIVYLVYLGLAFGLRSFLQWRATGSTGFVGASGQPGSAECRRYPLSASLRIAELKASH
ncbi:MAG: hypothetical protein IT336_16180 [Thermomicrobiales bacterium]|nr:hypothetical protein [Thermomicrobiales bacterium]